MKDHGAGLKRGSEGEDEGNGVGKLGYPPVLLLLLLLPGPAGVVNAVDELGLIGRYDRLQYQLWAAVEEGDEAAVLALVAAGADVDAADMSGEPPLYIAASLGHDAVVRVLLAAGAVVDKADAEWDTPLLIAAEEGHQAVVRALLVAGAAAGAYTRSC